MAYERASENVENLGIAHENEIAAQERRRTAEGRLRAVEDDLRKVLAEAGIAHPDLDEGTAAFQKLRKDVDEAKRLDGERASEVDRRAVTLRGRTISDLESEAARLRASAPAVAALDSLAKRERKDVERQLDGTAADVAAQEKDVSKLRGRVEEALRNEREQALVEDEIALYAEEIAALEEARESLLLAAEVLDDVSTKVHKEFAPVLEAELMTGMSAVTRGRYARGHVHPETLDVSVESTEAGRTVPSSLLSFATRAQALVLLRLAIAKFVGRAKELPPLLLDDPFVDCDSDRLAEVAAFLVRLSGEVQVIVATHSSTLAELLAETAGPGGLIVERLASPDHGRQDALIE